MMANTQANKTEQLNRYYRRSKISERKLRQIIRYFSQDLTASATTELVGLTRKSVNDIFLKIRARIAEECERQSLIEKPQPSEQITVGKNGFDGKIIYFGISKRYGQIYTEIVPKRLRAELETVFSDRETLSEVLKSEHWRGYDSVVDANTSKYIRFQHSNSEGEKIKHFDEVESFWSFIKRRLQKFNGLPAHTFYLHLKESEYRFNNRNEDLYKLLLRLLEKNPL